MEVLTALYSWINLYELFMLVICQYTCKVLARCGLGKYLAATFSWSTNAFLIFFFQFIICSRHKSKLCSHLLLSKQKCIVPKVVAGKNGYWLFSILTLMQLIFFQSSAVLWTDQYNILICKYTFSDQCGIFILVYYENVIPLIESDSLVT